MAGKTRTNLIRDAREKAIAEGGDPDQVERNMRQEWGMKPLDLADRSQREAKGIPIDVDEAMIRSERGKIKPENGNGSAGDQLDKELANIGGDGKHMTDWDRVKRDVQIIQLIKRGISTERAGAQFNLSARHVRRIIRKYSEDTPDIKDIDPAAVVRQTLWNYESAIEELALLAANTDHGPTKVGAIRVRLEALRGRIELLQSVGAVPHDLGQIRVLDDAQAVARQIAEIFEKHGVPEEVQFAIVDVIEGREPVYEGEATEVAHDDEEEIEEEDEGVVTGEAGIVTKS